MAPHPSHASCGIGEKCELLLMSPCPELLAPSRRLIVFLLLFTGDAVSSVATSEAGSGVSGLGALVELSACSRASPSPDRLRSLSVRSISLWLSLGSAVLSYLLGAAWLTQPNVTIPVSPINTCSR